MQCVMWLVLFIMQLMWERNKLQFNITKLICKFVVHNWAFSHIVLINILWLWLFTSNIYFIAHLCADKKTCQIKEKSWINVILVHAVQKLDVEWLHGIEQTGKQITFDLIRWAPSCYRRPQPARRWTSVSLRLGQRPRRCTSIKPSTYGAYLRSCFNTSLILFSIEII